MKVIRTLLNHFLNVSRATGNCIKVLILQTEQPRNSAEFLDHCVTQSGLKPGSVFVFFSLQTRLLVTHTPFSNHTCPPTNYRNWFPWQSMHVVLKINYVLKYTVNFHICYYEISIVSVKDLFLVRNSCLMQLTEKD